MVPGQGGPALSLRTLLDAATVLLLFVAATGATAFSYAWTGALVRRGSTGPAHASVLLVRGFAIPAVPVTVALTESSGPLLVVFAVISAFAALSGLETAVGSAAGGAIATAVGYGATFLVAVVVVVGAGLSLLAWRRDHSPV